MKFIDINSVEQTSLAKYSNTKIVLRKIEVIVGEVIDLFTPIRVTTKLPTGEMYQYYIHGTTFYSNRQPGKATDIPMEIVIQYCQYTELIISPISAKDLTFRLYYTIVEGESLKVIVSQDLEGYTFSLTPSGKETILSKFKEARPIRSIFVGYDVKQSFEMMHVKIQQHILPALTDLTDEQLDELGGVTLIDSRSNTEIKIN